MTRTTLLALATGAAVMAIGAPAALGHTRVTESEVTINLTPSPSGTFTVWWGHVLSPRAKCVNNRRVRLYRQAEGPDDAIGQDVTGSDPDTANNEYEILQEGNPPPEGTYYVRVLRKVLFRSARHRHVCAGARSETVLVN